MERPCNNPASALVIATSRPPKASSAADPVALTGKPRIALARSLDTTFAGQAVHAAEKAGRCGLRAAARSYGEDHPATKKQKTNDQPHAPGKTAQHARSRPRR